jgi:GH25 family lysozyme M1 (1,4-beta-N-acetylmuramidase)
VNDIKGIDVSDNNGIFDWYRWQGHIDFAMCKTGEGIAEEGGTYYIDKEFDRNWRRMHEMGIERFAYWFGHSNEDPADQAKTFVSLVKGTDSGLVKGDVLVLDLEVTDGNSPVDVSFWAWVFCREVQRHAPDHRIMVYTFVDFALNGNCAKLGERELWIADYDTPVPEVPPPWHVWVMWQYAGTGTDLDQWWGDDRRQLRHFCETTGLYFGGA